MLLDRISLKREAKDIVKCARVSAYGFTLLFLAISWLLNGLSDFVSLNEDMVYNIYYTTGVDLSFLILHRAFSPLLVTFVTVIVALLGVLLGAGYYLYHLGVRRGEEMPYLTLFDGFSFAGKLILLSLVRYIFVFLWSLLFIVPGIIAAYRYRYAMYNLCENPDLSIVEALDMSKRQTEGYKGQLFVLDLSYLGWGILASLPSTVEFSYLYLQILEDPAVFMADPTRLVPLIGSGLLMSLIIWLWSLAVQLFYLPNYQCVELGYFDIAKETSGVGAGARPQEGGWSGWNGGQDGWGGGPDDLGGY